MVPSQLNTIIIDQTPSTDMIIIHSKVMQSDLLSKLTPGSRMDVTRCSIGRRRKNRMSGFGIVRTFAYMLAKVAVHVSTPK